MAEGKSREEAFARLKTVLTTELPGLTPGITWIIRRVSFDVDLDRHISSADWPITDRHLLVMRESGGTGKREEKQSERHLSKAEVEILLWVFYDGADAASDEARCTLLNEAIDAVHDGLAKANLADGALGGDAWGKEGHRFEWERYEPLGGNRGLPPTAGASVPVEAQFYR
jgi:hypothetical protein